MKLTAIILFSDDAAVPRDIDSLLEETRQGLHLSGIKGPYVLVPHSVSGLHALYWAQRYPEEVSGIIGLDMAVPQSYDSYKANMPLARLGAVAARLGITRWLPGASESDAIKYGSLIWTVPITSMISSMISLLRRLKNILKKRKLLGYSNPELAFFALTQ